MPLGNPRFGLNRLEDEISRVNLAVRVRVGDADHLAFILEDQDVVDLLATPEFDVLFLPNTQQGFDFAGLEFGERKIMPRAVADDAGDAGRGPVAVNPLRRRQIPRSSSSHTRMIVVEDEGGGVLGVALAADACIAGTQVAVRDISRQFRLLMLDRLAYPRAVLPVGGNNHPFLTQGMPSFFPDHNLESSGV